MILALLDPLTLMTARLVCWAWRLASLELLTSPAPTRCVLRLIHSEDWEFCTSKHEHPLQALPRPKHLAWAVPNQQDALNSDRGSTGPWRLPLAFRIGSNLTPTVHMRSKDDHVFLSDVFGSATSKFLSLSALTFLSLPFPLVEGTLSVPMMLRQPTALRALHLQCGPFMWLRLLPCIRDLPHLKALGVVPLWNTEVLREVGALTRLTGLWEECDGYGAFISLAPLAALTALQSLSLNAWMWPGPSYRRAALAMVPSDELGSRVFRPTGSHLDPVLAALSNLSALHLLSNFDHKPFECVVTSRNCGSGPLELRHLVWECRAPSCTAWALATSLEHLCIAAKMQTCPALVQNLRMLSRLTVLRVSVSDYPEGWTSDVRFNTGWRVGTFLTGLTGLACLDLRNVLHAANVETDVCCIVCLTRLTCLCLNVNLNRPRQPRRWSRNILALPLRCMGVLPKLALPRAFTAFEQEGGFLQLTRLRQLRELCCDGPWGCLGKSPFLVATNDGRRELGWPPVVVSTCGSAEWATEFGMVSWGCRYAAHRFA